MLDGRAEAVPHQAVGGAVVCRDPSPGRRGVPAWLCNSMSIARLARRDAGLADVVLELLGVGPEAAVAGRPAVDDVDVPADDQGVRPGIEHFQHDASAGRRVSSQVLRARMLRVPALDELAGIEPAEPDDVLEALEDVVRPHR